MVMNGRFFGIAYSSLSQSDGRNDSPKALIASPCGISRFAQSHFPAQSAQFVQFGLRENIHLIDNPRNMPGKEGSDDPAALGCQMNRIAAPVLLIPDALDKPAHLEIIDNHRNITATLQNFLAELFLIKGSNMKKCFKNPKLAHS